MRRLKMFSSSPVPTHDIGGNQPRRVGIGGSNTWGGYRMYEYDFEGQRSGTYLPSLTLPLPHALA